MLRLPDSGFNMAAYNIPLPTALAEPRQQCPLHHPEPPENSLFFSASLNIGDRRQSLQVRSLTAQKTLAPQARNHQVLRPQIRNSYIIHMQRMGYRRITPRLCLPILLPTSLPRMRHLR